LPFIKIEGLGNDYIYVDRKSFSGRKFDFAVLARLTCDRHKGIGADGLIVMNRTGAASAMMSIHNSDGSEAEFCGNGLRGTALYLKSVYRSKSRKYAISTCWDDYQVEIIEVRNKEAIVRAVLGSPSFNPEDIGYTGNGRTCLGVPAHLGGRKRSLFCVAVPNPHAVVFVDGFDFNWRKEGSALEKSPMFRNGVNVMFTKVNSRDRITIMPWERGAGATMACGSGAAAATVISSLLEYTDGNVAAVMPGGSLVTRWDIAQNEIYQEGPTRIAFFGSYNI
jgi:diaminopimelate epimerase